MLRSAVGAGLGQAGAGLLGARPDQHLVQVAGEVRRVLGAGDQAGEGAAETGAGEQPAQQALHLPQFAWLHGDFHTGNLLT